MDILSAIPKFEPPKPVEIVKPVDKKPVVREVVQKPLTGHDLLDKLFFT